jgi:TolA-binding protein
MKIQLVAGLAALATLAAVPALAQAPATTTTTTTTTTAGPMSVDKTTIGALWANPTSKAVLEKNVPGIEQYMDQIKDMTLAQVAPMSQGAIDDAKLKAIQADLDKAGK